MSEQHPPSPQRRGGAIRLRLLLGFIAVAVAIGLLVIRSAKDEMVYYITVSELLAKQGETDMDGLRVTGTVVPGTIESEPLYLRFQMTDGEKAIPIEYRGIIPDTFGDKGEVVVEGRYLNSGTFEADFLMAKCPSKYEMSPDEEMPEGMPKPSKTG